MFGSMVNCCSLKFLRASDSGPDRGALEARRIARTMGQSLLGQAVSLHTIHFSTYLLEHVDQSIAEEWGHKDQAWLQSKLLLLGCFFVADRGNKHGAGRIAF